MSDIKFYYPFHWITQFAAFQGLPDLRVKEAVGSCHISLGGALLCRQDPVMLELELKADGHETVATRRSGVPICHDCQEVWKRLPGSPWSAWENQEAKRV